MEFKGTPAPWEVKPEEVDKSYIRIRGTRLGCRFKIANVLTPVYEGAHPREADETRSNAYIIAAAPELLEQLIRLRNKIASYKPDDDDDLDIVDAVISKALGQQ